MLVVGVVDITLGCHEQFAWPCTMAVTCALSVFEVTNRSSVVDTIEVNRITNRSRSIVDTETQQLRCNESQIAVVAMNHSS